jgi:hypothetical protein
MRTLSLLMLASLAGACGSREAPRPETTDSAGVTLVWNRGPDRPLAWTFEPLLTLGGEDEGPEAFFGIGSGGIATDGSGNIFVLDRGNFRVVVFDSEGRHVRSMGRHGGGPGELQFPTWVLTGADGSVSVADIARGGLVRFSADGTPLDQIRLEGWYGGRLAHTGEAIILEMQATVNDTSYAHIVRFGDDPPPLVAWRRPPVQPVDFGCVRISGMLQVFAPALVWTTGPGFVAVAGGTDYAVDRYEGLRLVRRARRDLAPRATTRAMALQEIGDDYRIGFGGGGGCAVPAERVVDAQGVAPVVPAIGALAVGPDGTVWVRRRVVRGEPAPIDVLDPAGVYVGTLPAGSPFPATFQPDGSLIAIATDELDVQRIVVYRVIRH